MVFMSILLLVFRILLVISLYLFIGWVVYTLWIEIYRRPTKQDESDVALLTLTYQEAGNPHTFRLNQKSAGIGRDTGNEVSLPDAAVADRHATLTYHQGQWWLENIHTNLSTLLNNERVNDSVVLINRDVIIVGPYHLEVMLEEK
jgi:pSer/pThr/pTyr-binding forkhead associated (FHA) protein